MSLAKEVLKLCESLSNNELELDISKYNSGDKLRESLEKVNNFKDLKYKGENLFELLCRKYNSKLLLEVEQFIHSNYEYNIETEEQEITYDSCEFLSLYYNIAESDDYFVAVFELAGKDMTRMELKVEFTIDKNRIDISTELVDLGYNKYLKRKDNDKVLLIGNDAVIRDGRRYNDYFYVEF